MLAVVKDKPGPGFTFKEVNIPKPKDDEVLIQVKSVGICGSDIPIFKGIRKVDYPLIPGHEFSGVIVKKGDKVENFQIGDKVIPGLVVPCGTCIYCKQGLESLCENLWEIGIHRDGAFAEFVIAPEKTLHKMPQNLDFDDGASIDPIASAYRPVMKVNIHNDDIVVIFGPGPIGLYALQIVLAEGAKKVVVVGTQGDEERLKLAKEIGADLTVNVEKEDPSKVIQKLTDGKMADVIIEATGVPSVVDTCLKCLSKNGRLSLAGIFHQKASIDLAPIVRREYHVFGSICYTWLDFQACIDLVAMGKVKTNPIISHRFKLKEMEKALNLAYQRKSTKIILHP